MTQDGKESVDSTPEGKHAKKKKRYQSHETSDHSVFELAADFADVLPPGSLASFGKTNDGTRTAPALAATSEATRVADVALLLSAATADKGRVRGMVTRRGFEPLDAELPVCAVLAGGCGFPSRAEAKPTLSCR